MIGRRKYFESWFDLFSKGKLIDLKDEFKMAQIVEVKCRLFKWYLDVDLYKLLSSMQFAQ